MPATVAAIRLYVEFFFGCEARARVRGSRVSRVNRVGMVNRVRVCARVY